MKDFWKRAHELEASDTAFVVITMLSSRGHAPANPGAKAIITMDGLYFGTVGGGKIELQAIREAISLLESGLSEPKVQTWNLTTDIGMTCGGEVSLLFEAHNPRAWQIVIFGAGHVAQALTRALMPLNCHLTVVDSRAEWLEKLPPSIKRVCLKEPQDFVCELNEQCFSVVMTQGHGTDLPILEKLLRKFAFAPFVGVMGSEIKAKRIRHDLHAQGIPEAIVGRLVCPIGLDLGSNAPSEIAISVAGQLLKVRDAWLKTKTGSHEVAIQSLVETID